MAGVNNRVQLRQGLLKHLRDMETVVVNSVVVAAKEAGDSGVEVIREVIAGTPSDLSRLPKGNRNWTGHMSNSAESKVTRTGSTIKIRMGWLNRSQDDWYIATQEYGGNVNGKTVRAMSALTFAEREAIRVLKDKGVL